MRALGDICKNSAKEGIFCADGSGRSGAKRVDELADELYVLVAQPGDIQRLRGLVAEEIVGRYAENRGDADG